MKLIRRAFWSALIIGIVYAVLMPNFIGCGGAWLTVHVRALDATTRQPIPAAAVTLISEQRTKTSDMRVSPPTILSAQTDNEGRATVKDMFGAGFDNGGTSIYVGTSSVRCDAAGYTSTEVRESPKSRLRFHDFLIYKQHSSIDQTLTLTRQ